MSYSKTQLNRLAGNVPIGTVISYAGAAAPAGYLLCDGTAVSRATYAELFSIISTTYGVGNGSTTFNLPDLRGRVAVGAGTGTGGATSGSGAITGAALTARTAGQWDGRETHTLTDTQSGVPVHGHAHTISTVAVGNLLSDPGHSHGGYHRNTTIGGSATGDDPVDYCFDPASHGFNANTAGAGTGASTVSHGHSISGGVTNHAGSSAASSHNNVQPFVVVNRIIRYASASTVASPVRNEVPSGTINGSNTIFTIANIPNLNTQEVYLNGVRQRPGAGNDYTISGATITFLTAPTLGSNIIVDYFVGG